MMMPVQDFIDIMRPIPATDISALVLGALAIVAIKLTVTNFIMIGNRAMQQELKMREKQKEILGK